MNNFTLGLALLLLVVLQSCTPVNFPVTDLEEAVLNDNWKGTWLAIDTTGGEFNTGSSFQIIRLSEKEYLANYLALTTETWDIEKNISFKTHLSLFNQDTFVNMIPPNEDYFFDPKQNIIHRISTINKDVFKTTFLPFANKSEFDSQSQLQDYIMSEYYSDSPSSLDSISSNYWYRKHKINWNLANPSYQVAAIKSAKLFDGYHFNTPTKELWNEECLLQIPAASISTWLAKAQIIDFKKPKNEPYGEPKMLLIQFQNDHIKMLRINTFFEKIEDFNTGFYYEMNEAWPSIFEEK